VNYLLKSVQDPEYDDIPKRPGAAIAILVIFYVLLFLWALAYFRILLTIVSNPGYTRKRLGPRSTWSREKDGRSTSELPRTAIDRQGILEGRVSPPPGIEKFTNKEVFVCDPSGLPIFCDTCNNYKPDRTHHCSEVNRCVRRMDHFCPWIGGVVSETTTKFFIQMTFYGTLFSLFLCAVSVWLLIDQRSIMVVNGNWVATAAVGGFFSLICLGMTANSIKLALKNMTTVEELGGVYFLAIHVDHPEQYGGPPPIEGPSGTTRPYYQTITYPLRPSAAAPTGSAGSASEERDNVEANGSSNGLRTFVVVQSRPSDNPWCLDPLQNLKSVMGHSYIDWLLPLKYSPCCLHDDPESDYPLGPDIERLKREYGLKPWQPPPDSRKHRKRRRRHSHRRESASRTSR
jgi:palmitoyltransferase